VALDDQYTPIEFARDAIFLALSFHADRGVDPIAELQFAESPEKFSFLLQLASGDPAALSASTSSFPGDAELHKTAAVQYLVHHCFSREQDPWRVLGLNKRTSADEVKRRYHQMIKLFHPDRGLLALDQLQNFSVKINHAYQTIKRQDELAVNDFSNHFNSSQKSSSSAIQSAPWHFNARLLSKFLFGLIVLGLLVLYLKFNLVGHEILISDGSLRDDQESQVSLASDSKNDVAEQVEALEKADAQAIAETSLAQQHQRIQPKSLPAIQSDPTIKLNNLVTNQIKIKEVEQKQDEAVLVNSDVSSHQLPYKQSLVSSSSLLPVDQIPSKIRLEEPEYVAPKSISQKDLKLMIMKLMDTYNQGSLDGMMSLMADNIKVNGSAGKDDLRLSYGMLFAKSKYRDMVLKDVRWELNGTKATGTMGYVAQIKKHGDSSFEVHQGMFNLDVAMLNERLLIVGLQTTEAKN
jgi:curved DNA-binding protein CbpA